MSISAAISKFLTGFAAFSLLAFAQHGGGGGAHGANGGGAHTGGGGMHAGGSGFQANPGFRAPSPSRGYPSGGAFPAGGTGSPYATSGGAFPAGVHGSPYAPLRSSPRVGIGAYPGVSSFGGYGRGRYGSGNDGRHKDQGPWRDESRHDDSRHDGSRHDGYRHGRQAYGVPFAYFAPYGYLGTPFSGEYDSGFVNSTPYDNGYDNAYNTGGYDGAVNGEAQPPPYAEQQPYPEQAPYGPSAPDPYAQYPIPLRNPDAASAPTVSEPLPPSPPVSLVLNSGETRKVQSYAIVGNIFWDLSSHPPRKIPVSSINVEASTKATEAAGAEFPDIAAAH